ncbi:BCL2 interacting protein 3 [Rhynchophorus ferrugineus]|uniref:BCL2/adenovirus E1B 19 kDa protein-interacting protein 3 n=1 Tax=Rhynchophorus ferrugineus TaxID=354439 RepID=A0A834J306_RHYFE|nr:hypothetical protein GWI33_002821 [Rhynchophorus ferrugineus]
MSSSKSSVGNDDILGESWVDLAPPTSQSSGTPASINHLLSVEEYLRLLREAQESTQSSCRDSLAGSRRDSPRSSPKSPPNSPIVQNTPLNLEWQSYYVNSELKEDFSTNDWSSRPDSMPPKPWSFRAPHKYDTLSLRYARIGNTPLFSKRGLCIMFLTNLVSLILGTGVGLFLNRHGLYYSPPSIKLR